VKLILAPGNFVCDLVGLPDGSDHRQILRLYSNTLIWGVVAIAVALAVTL